MQPAKPEPKPIYPSRYNFYQGLFLAATLALLVLAIISRIWEQAAYLSYALGGFFLARHGLENPKPKEVKKP